MVSIAMPSTPGAPVFALTCRQASQRTSARQTWSYRLSNLFFFSCLEVLEGSLQCPDLCCSVGSREAIGPPTLLRAPWTAAGLLPSHPVSRAIQAVLGAPRTSCQADSDFGAALYAAVPRGHRGPGKISRPAT